MVVSARWYSRASSLSILRWLPAVSLRGRTREMMTCIISRRGGARVNATSAVRAHAERRVCIVKQAGGVHFS